MRRFGFPGKLRGLIGLPLLRCFQCGRNFYISDLRGRDYSKIRLCSEECRKRRSEVIARINNSKYKSGIIQRPHGRMGAVVSHSDDNSASSRKAGAQDENKEDGK